MDININVKNKKEFYEKYLLCLNPFIRIKEDTDIPLLACFLVFMDKYRDHYNPENNNLYNVLFSKESKKSIIEGLKITEKSFNKSFERLKNKNIITKDNKINDVVLYPFYKKDYEIRINFKSVNNERR
jgi:hypothetical protein